MCLFFFFSKYDEFLRATGQLEVIRDTDKLEFNQIQYKSYELWVRNETSTNKVVLISITSTVRTIIRMAIGADGLLGPIASELRWYSKPVLTWAIDSN